jgi:hypothetical protein
MAGHAASLHSIEALRTFKLALQTFESSVQDALVALELETRRPVEWVENDRSRYWPREERKASDAVIEARQALERCELTTSADSPRYCYDERKALEKAKRRWRLTEEKVQAVKRWRQQIRKEAQEFQVQISKVKRFMESDFLGAIAALERMSAALEQYVQRPAAGPTASSPSPNAESPE